MVLRLIVSAVIDDASSRHVLGGGLFIRLEDAERFIDEVRDDEPGLAAS